MYVIRGILRLTSPLHIAAPRKETVDPDTDRLLPSGERGIMVVPATKYRLPMFVRGSQTASIDAIEEADVPRGSAFADVPVIPANDLRGRLRRFAARKVFDVLLARNEQISLDAYHGMTCGAVICGIYHNRSHSDLDGKSPLERWKQGSGEGVESASSSVARPDRYVRGDTEQLRIDFLPGMERVITRNGVQIDAIRYMGSALQPWINTRNPKDQNRSRLFTFRRDPQDISVIYFWNPELEKYEPVPCCAGFQCSMTIWDWRAFVKHQITTSKVRSGEEIKAMILDLIRDV